MELDRYALEQQGQELAARGYRVLASGEMSLQTGEVFSGEHLQRLNLIGLVGMIDPLRPEAKAAVAACRDAGTAAAQLIHIEAMYTPWLSDVLRIQSISLQHWGLLLGMALTVLVVMELHKVLRRRLDARPAASCVSDCLPYNTTSRA